MLEGLLNVNQSAYKSSHSTETTLLKIQTDIALSVDSGKAVALTLLDLSAAFDTIDHSLLYDCLHDWFGLDGTVLSWIKSYLSNRKIGDSFSEAVILPFRISRTKFIIIGQKAIRKSLAPNFPVPLLQNNISPSVEVKNLGVISDSDNSFAEHVTIIFVICDEFANSLESRQQYFWQMLWSVAV